MKKLSILLAMVFLLTGCGLIGSENTVYELYGNDRIGYFEMPKGSKIEDKSDKSTPILSGKVANSKIKVQVVGYSSATNFNRSMESTLTMLKSYRAKKINPVVRTDGQMYSVVLTSSDKPYVAGILFYPLNSYLTTMIILKSENDKPIDVKKLDIGRVSKSYRFKKTDKVKDYKECKAYPSVFDNMMAGMIEFPHEYQWDKKDQTYKSADGLTKIQINQNPVFMGMNTIKIPQNHLNKLVQRS